MNRERAELELPRFGQSDHGWEFLSMAYPFRVERRSLIRTQAAGVATQSPAQQQLADYISRLIKLIPTEIVGLYLTVRGFWKGSTNSGGNLGQQTFLTSWPLVCMVLVIMSRAWGTRSADGAWETLQWVPIAIATVSFVIWIYAVGDTVLGFEVTPPAVSTAIVIWMFIVPYFYTGER